MSILKKIKYWYKKSFPSYERLYLETSNELEYVQLALFRTRQDLKKYQAELKELERLLEASKDI